MGSNISEESTHFWNTNYTQQLLFCLFTLSQVVNLKGKLKLSSDSETGHLSAIKEKILEIQAYNLNQKC